MNKKVSILILLSGIFFSLSFFKCIKRGVFYSGDAGLKYLQTKQIANGDLSLSLNLKGDNLTQNLWHKGYYPFSPPFVYKLQNRYYTPFSYIFSLLSALFYKFFSFYGLRIIPILSLWGTWLLFLLYGKNFKGYSIILLIFLFSLIFSTPLTFYGATFWEHTLGVFLIFWAFLLIFYREKLFHGGVLSSIAIILRPEISIFSFFLLLIIILREKRFKKSKVTDFLKGFFPIIALYFILNLIEFGTIFGIHSMEVTRGFSLSSDAIFFKIKVYFLILKLMSHSLINYLPQILLLPIIIFMGEKSEIREKTILILLTLILTPLILPNAGGMEFGPRYFLFLIPIFYFVFMECVILNSNKWLKTGVVLIFLFLTFLNIHKSTSEAREIFCEDKGILKAINLLEKEKEKYIIIDNQWIAQNFALLMGEKFFLLAKDRNQFITLLYQLKREGINRLILIQFVKGKVKDKLNIKDKMNFGKIATSIKKIFTSSYFRIYSLEIFWENKYYQRKGKIPSSKIIIHLQEKLPQRDIHLHKHHNQCKVQDLFYRCHLQKLPKQDILVNMFHKLYNHQ